MNKKLLSYTFAAPVGIAPGIDSDKDGRGSKEQREGIYTEHDGKLILQIDVRWKKIEEICSLRNGDAHSNALAWPARVSTYTST